MVAFLITALITAISLLVISYIPFVGVEIDSPGKALISGFVFGLLNAFLKPILNFLGAPINFLTLGLFSLIVNVIIFGLTAKLVEGFRLRNKFVSAILGAFLLALINSLLFSLLINLGLVAPA